MLSSTVVAAVRRGLTDSSLVSLSDRSTRLGEPRVPPSLFGPAIDCFPSKLDCCSVSEIVV